MTKKFAFLLVLLVFSLSLVGCAKKDSAQEDQYYSAGQDSPSGQSNDVQPADSQSGDTPVSAQLSVPTTNSDSKTMPDITKPQTVIDQNKSYSAVMHTDAGDITISLNAKATPITVNNFVWLAKNNFYNNTSFHRVIKGFMIQGGDPKGDGTGGPGYSFADEPFTGSYERGTIAMANAGPNTNGSQFFIMHASYPLPKNYVIFGQVTKGLESVDKIAEAPVKVSVSGEMSQPLQPIVVDSIDIIEK